MARAPLPPLTLPWKMKPLTSARTTVEKLADGRVRWAIVHDILRDVTPTMLVYWLNHMDGVVNIAGVEMSRYRAWHPRDHVRLTYVRPGKDGRKFSAGAKVRIEEFFAGKVENRIDATDVVVFLDETGFRHQLRVGPIVVADMTYRFEARPEGTHYENNLTVGIPGWPWFNRTIRPRLFPDAQGNDWLLHNVEEVGNLEHFLPSLYAEAMGAAASR